eukprot:9253298-Heterocapsa_arctica.AAC.1
MEGRRMAPTSQASAPSMASTRAPDANPAIIWMFGFPVEMMNKQLRQFATTAVENKITGWSSRIVIKANNLDQKCSIEFDPDLRAHKFLDICREDKIYFTMKQGTAEESRHEI